MQRVFVVDVVIDFSDSVVAGIRVGKGAGEAGCSSRIIREQTAGARHRRSQFTTCQIQAGWTDRHVGVLQRGDRIHEACFWIGNSLRHSFGSTARDECIADEGTQAFIASEEKKFVFLDRSANNTAKLFQLCWQLIASMLDGVRASSVGGRRRVKSVAGIPTVRAAERIRGAV